MRIEAIYQQIKEGFSLKVYFIICVSLALLSLFLPVSAVADGSSLYMYRIGIGVPWVTIYKNADLGISNFIGIFKASGYRGIEWMPQNLMLLAGGVYIIYILIYCLKNREVARHLY
mgnify:FL=1